MKNANKLFIDPQRESCQEIKIVWLKSFSFPTLLKDSSQKSKSKRAFNGLPLKPFSPSLAERLFFNHIMRISLPQLLFAFLFSNNVSTKLPKWLRLMFEASDLRHRLLCMKSVSNDCVIYRQQTSVARSKATAGKGIRKSKGFLCLEESQNG